MALGAAQISLRAVRDEFVGPAGQVSLRAYRRGGSYVREKAANDSATNMAAAVSTTTNVSMRSFRNQARLFKYTNAAVINNSSMQAWFGDDWSVDYPKEFVNNNSCHGTNTSNWGFRVDGGTGERRLVNNGNILGAGGASQSAAGGHALYINSTGLKVWNNYQIFAGGGGGGHGGTGGAGGTGYTQAWVFTGYLYNKDPGTLSAPGAGAYWVRDGGGAATYYAYGAGYVAGGQGIAGWVPGFASPDGYYYEAGPYVQNIVGNNMYQIRRATLTNTYYSGGAGGGGGTGGRGQGADGANAGGTAGAGGAAGGTNAGAGGAGGAGGTGGGWGAYGATGATGAGGGYGNWSGWGPGGSGGTAGGAPGYYIYAVSSWVFYVNVSALGLYYSVV